MSADIVAAMRALLVSKTAVTDEVSTRVYPGEIPQNATLPAVRLNIIGGESLRHQEGISRVGNQELQVDVVSETWVTAHTVAEVIRKELDNFEGTAGSQAIRGTRAETLDVSLEAPRDGTDEHYYIHSRQYRVWYEEAALNT